MMLSQRIRALRTKRSLSQGDMEKITGLRRQYISRVENGRTMPSLETLERLAHALEVPLYRLFYEGVRPPKALRLASKAKDPQPQQPDRFTNQLLRLLLKVGEEDRRLLLAAAQKLAQRRRAAAAEVAASDESDDEVAAD